MISRWHYSIKTGACVLVTLLAASGCSDWHAQDSRDRYRTVRTPPMRDTAAARQANDQGLEHLNAGRLDEAAEAFKQALNADVDFGPAHNNLGKVYYKQKKWYEAAWEFELAKKLLPTNAAAPNNLGLVLEQAQRFDEAVEEYRLAVKFAPDNVAYKGNLARVLIRRGDRGEEVRLLLEQVACRATDPNWTRWARRQLARLDAEAN